MPKPHKDLKQVLRTLPYVVDELRRVGLLKAAVKMDEAVGVAGFEAADILAPKKPRGK